MVISLNDCSLDAVSTLYLNVLRSRQMLKFQNTNKSLSV